MTTKEFNEQRRRIRRLCDKWMPRLGMSWHRLELNYSEERDGGNPDSAAHSRSAWEYKDASITWFCPVTATIDDKFLERIVVHEMAHVLVAPMRSHDVPMENEELVCTTLADAFMWTAEEVDKATRKELRRAS